MIETLKSAGAGWSAILGRKPEWRDHFRFDAEGMNIAAIVYGVTVLFAIVMATLRIGFPPPDAIVLLLIGHLIPIVAVILATMALRAVTNDSNPSTRYYVPMLFLLALMKIVEGLAVLAGVPLAGAILAVTGILAFRLAQANDRALAPAIGYGLGVFLLLVGLPVAIYMLLSLIQ